MFEFGLTDKDLNNNTSPILKWAGGKGAILSILESNLPESIQKNKTFSSYIEPFIGGGSFFFHLSNNYNIEKAVISDFNKELVLLYKVIKLHLDDLIPLLINIRLEYLNSSDKEHYYYEQRKKFNSLNPIDLNCIGEQEVLKSAIFIFLNKTGFNGLYRISKKGNFSTPWGKKVNPDMVNLEKYKRVSKSLQNVTIIHGDFSETLKYVEKDSFIYLDPPYRPLDAKNNFTAYSKEDFNDESQIRLCDYTKKISSLRACFMESNSDPKNVDRNDDFFDELYKGNSIQRIQVTRTIGQSKDKIDELLIKNY
jgi:DNA adenine methylase